ncbi:MAG: hypothetical protein RXO28_07755 [Thermocladium sp.]
MSGVRWAYTDAKLINARPLVLARGFSDVSWIWGLPYGSRQRRGCLDLRGWG